MKKLRILHYYLTAGLLSCIKLQRVILLFLSVSLFGSLQAGVVTEQQALQKAEQFLKGKKIKSSGITRGEKKSAAYYDNAFYVFNVENNGGFVIVSGDDRTPEILGYAESGLFDSDNLPPAMKALLNYYGYQIKQIQSGQKRATTRGISHENIDDLLTTKWNQGDPYNMYAPMGYTSNDDTPRQCVTGCVATAMAQVLYYQKCVNSTQAVIPGYELQWESPSGDKSETLSDIEEGTALDWGNMLYSYKEEAQATDIQKQAVANLMLYCGMAVNMQYGPDGSSASLSSVPSALKDYFGYSRGTKYIQRNWYTDDEWDNLIYNEISLGRPVIYGGQTENNEGHAFIVHGYKDGLYAINWGWGGSHDAYFLLDNLTPSGQGTGGGTVGQGFNLQQDAVINLQKEDGSFSETVRFTTEYMRLGAQNVFTADNGSFEFSFEVKFTSRLANAYDISYNFALYKDGDFMCNLSSDTNVQTFENFSSSHCFPSTGSMSFKLGNLLDGVYKIVPISRQYGTDTWLENEGSDKYYLSAVVNGDQLKLYVGEPSNEDPDIVFTEKTEEGIDVTYKVLDIEAKTVQIGEGAAESQAINCNTTGTVTIPAKVNDYTVVALGEYAFANCSDVAKVVLPEGITAIPDYAFYKTQSLKEVVIPASVTSIGSHAFDTSGLSEVSIPSSVTSIGVMAFNLNGRLMKIIVNMTTPFAINDNVFSNDDANVNTYGRATLVVPAGMIDTYKGVSGWSKFATVTDELPQEFKKVVNDVEMVFTITGDNTVQVGYQTGDWEKRAIPYFDDQNKIENKDLTIPSSVSYNYHEYDVTAIGDYAFNCMHMKTITLSSTIQTIGKYAFWSANMMRSFELPSGVISIGAGALGCNLLTSLTVAAGNTKYISPEGSNAIIETSETSTMKLVVGIASTEIPESVTTIGSYAFSSQEGLVLTIPQTISFIENCAFDGSNGVITVEWENPIEVDGDAFSGIKNSMILRVPSGCKKAYEEKDGWKKFKIIKEGDDAAVFKATIENVEITFMVVSEDEKTVQVGVGGFGSGARAIEQKTEGPLTIPETVNDFTVVALADYSLRNCYRLTSISIPKTVVSIGKEALASCFEVTEFKVDADNPNFCDVEGVIYSKDKKAVLFYPVGAARTEYSIPSGVETIGSYAFDSSNYLTSVELPEGLKTIEECAFMDCYYIETINIPASLETLGNQAFGYCNGMLNYNVAEGNTHFSSLNGVLFNAGQTKLIQYPGGKTGSYVIPNSVTSIGASAFGTVNLSELTIPNSVTEFGGFAFTNCNNMTVIRSLIENPYDISETVFSGIGYKTILYVPKGLKNKYLSYKNWDKIPCLMEDTGVTYEVLNNQVVVTAADKQKEDGNFNILANLMVNNEEMAVTAIAADAFKGIGVMKSVMIPASIETIGDGAFANCSNLTQVVNMNTTPISLTPATNNSRALTRGINVSQFSGVNENCTLFVLKDAKSDYQNTAGWNDFHIESFAGLGDVNYDEDINVTDVVVEVNQILCKDPGKFVFTIGDMNADDEVNVTDVVMMVNVILGRAHSRGVEDTDNQSVTTTSDHLRLESAEDGSLSLCLDNVAQYVAAQFDVRVSEGQSLDKVTKGVRSGSHQLAMAKIGHDLYRVIMYGFGDAVFAGQSGEVVNLGISGEGDVSVENITFVTGNKISRNFADMSGNTRGTTGIEAIDMTFDAPADIYDMNGRLLRRGAKTTQGLKPNVYIVNGKKVMVK